MRRIGILALGALLAGMTLFCVTGLPNARAAQAPSEKAALVNGTAITRAELEREMGRVVQGMRRLGRALDPSRVRELEGKVLENLIDRELLFQQAGKKGIHVNDGDLAKAMKGLKKRFPKAEDFRRALARAGLTESDLKDQIRRGLTIKKLVEKEFADRMTVTGKEAEAYYKAHAESFKRPEEVRASHILAKVAPGAPDTEKTAARKRIEEVRKKLDQGEDFAALAKRYSQGPSSSKGGDLGYFSRGRMAKPFETAAFAMKPGQVSDLVETRFGYHLIKVTGRRPGGTVPFAEVKDKLVDFLRQKKLAGLLKDYVAQLKKEAQISRFLKTGNEKKGPK
ncbi:MAG: peptidylprolyl isomerase [Deltaproteobacteria bacterium]|nr:peptidylprolyl isomerase [Deltaproteobacteria bacterium]MBW1922966.1 peptidylprolyl isomerase [Deltaproteobacteria bacterium]MBW1949054.1 peptidylprolyl isomerase [Deltaproteobacteria bacterium]MBW2007394.1 peptidylprolyl isomerase [Deltaproteobacteria bacterium]MBW2101778.1 peptidylprolyl isomerase [Deltaproteobacteria bacterium]